MQYQEAKNKFISTWGTLSCEWGICKTMGQIHALLLISPEPLCSEMIMRELDISRGNVNMNLRSLIDWGIVHKSPVVGERKEYFEAEKDIWKVFKKIVRKRKEKELGSMIKLLDSIQPLQEKTPETTEFNTVVKDIERLARSADSALDNLVNSESNFLLSSVLKVMR